MAKPMLIAGNWKMNGLKASLDELALMKSAADAAPDRIRVAIAPPFTLVRDAAALAAGSRLQIGGQDCHDKASGAHTGCVSAEMLADAGAGFVIAGHSERRTDNHESDADVRAKVIAARAAGLDVIVCVGETEAERDAGAAETVVGRQLAGSLPGSVDGLTVAYEPVWAIGTGRTPSLADIAAMHSFIRQSLAARFGSHAQRVAVLYGGSVKPGNASEILALADVGGALVGGASLKAADFLPIIAAA
jgi:triosephosphate isomerase